MHFEIVVGSVLGASEYVADAVEELLNKKGHQFTTQLQPDFSQTNFDEVLLIITSTHGAGDLPDNIQIFADELAKAELPNCKFIVIGLGDTSYDTYCQGARTMEELLIKAKATQLHPPLHIDVLQHPVPEELAIEWLEQVVDKL